MATNLAVAWEILPEVVWDLTLKEIDDSRTIDHLVKVFPELEVLLANKPFWYFDQVLPHIIKYGPEEILKTCRQVCKRWFKVTEAFVENHPSRRAYSQKLNRRTLPFSNFNYEELLQDVLGCYTLQSEQEMSKFKQDFAFQPLGPLSCKVIHFCCMSRNSNAVLEFMDCVETVFELFGKHTKNLTISFPLLEAENLDPQSTIQFVDKILNCLTHLQDCCSICLNFELDMDLITPQAVKKRVYTKLPSIECISFGGDVPATFQKVFLENCDTYLKLTTSAALNSFGNLCPGTLTELDLECDEEDLNICLNFLNLKKLSLKSKDWIGLVHLFNLLKTLNLLEELQLFECSFNETDCTSAVQFDSIKFLSVRDEPREMLEWVQHFPSADHLEIVRITNTRDFQEPTNLTQTLRNYLYPDQLQDDANVWNILPSLQVLTTSALGNLNSKVLFVRECGNKSFRA